MKKLALVSLAAAAVFAGCDAPKSPEQLEAEAFGYRGIDLQELSETNFFATAVGATNWIPARVMAVYENYDFGPKEQALVKAFNVLQPSIKLSQIPEGYALEEAAPWLQVWGKKTEVFGFEGISRFYAHFNEDKNVYELGSMMFSTYSKSVDEANAKLLEIRESLVNSADFAPLKIYEFPEGDKFVAEYLRVSLIALVGKKSDDVWSTMVTISDKSDMGCGQWESVAEQQDRRNRYNYRKALAQWKVDVAELWKENHAACVAQLKSAGLAGFDEKIVWRVNPNNANMYCIMTDAFCVEPSNPRDAAEKALAACREKIKNAIGLELPEEKQVTNYEMGDVELWCIEAEQAPYFVRLEMAIPLAAEENATETAREEEVCSHAEMRGQWRIVCFEGLADGRMLPAKPVDPDTQND